MIASAKTSGDTIHGIAQRAAKIKDHIGLSIGNFIAVAVGGFVATFFIVHGIIMTHDQLSKLNSKSEVPYLDNPDLWFITVTSVIIGFLTVACVMLWPLEKILLRQEHTTMDRLALTLAALMFAAIATFFILEHMSDIGKGLDWVIYQIQLHTVGFEPSVTRTPDNMA